MQKNWFYGKRYKTKACGMHRMVGLTAPISYEIFQILLISYEIE